MFYFYPYGGILLNDEVLFKNAAETLPFSFYILITCLNLAVSFIAGTFPVIMGDEQLKHSCIIGGITSLFAGMNFYLIPFPLWYHSISMLLFIPSSYLGGYVLKKVVMQLPIAAFFINEA